MVREILLILAAILSIGCASRPPKVTTAVIVVHQAEVGAQLKAQRASLQDLAESLEKATKELDNLEMLTR